MNHAEDDRHGEEPVDLVDCAYDGTVSALDQTSNDEERSSGDQAPDGSGLHVGVCNHLCQKGAFRRHFGAEEDGQKHRGNTATIGADGQNGVLEIRVSGFPENGFPDKTDDGRECSKKKM